MKKLLTCALIFNCFALANGQRTIENYTVESHIARPAVGTILPAPLVWSADSVIALNVGHIADSEKPSAFYSYRVESPMPRVYQYDAWVRIDRTEGTALIRFEDGDGNAISDLQLKAGTNDGDILPGVWTRVSLQADIRTNSCSALVLKVLPQWNAGRSVVSNTRVPIAVYDAQLWSEAGDASTVSGAFEYWTTNGNGIRKPYAWNVDNPVRVAGAHVVDNALLLKAGQSASLNFGNTLNANTLSFKALASEPVNLKIQVDDYTSAIAVSNKSWRTYRVPISFAQNAKLTLSTDGQMVIDDVEALCVYDEFTPRPPQQQLVVTSSADKGEGSLRQVLTDAPNFSEIVFNVDHVDLASKISLGYKSLYITGADVVINGPEDACIFDIQPAYDGIMLSFKGLKFSGKSSLVNNGGAISVSDSRNTNRCAVKCEDCHFESFNVTSNGGAVYLNSPATSAEFTNCYFANCSASNGAAIANTKSPVFSATRCKFTNCTTKGTTGGALSLTSGGISRVMYSQFDACKSTATSGGAGAISIQSLAGEITIARSTFTGCEGGRGSAVSIYNNSRGTLTLDTRLINNTFVGNVGESPVVSVGRSSTYPIPGLIMVNNVSAANSASSLVSPGDVTGTHNLLENTDITLENALNHHSVEPSFLRYDSSAKPLANTNGVFPINSRGALHDSATKKYGEDIVSQDIIDGDIACVGYSVGATEMCDLTEGFSDLTIDARQVFEYIPYTKRVRVLIDTEKLWLTDVHGRVLLCGHCNDISLTNYTQGTYIISASVAGKIVSQKIVIK